MLVKDMYDTLALQTGFPVYTNETDTPETNRFLVEILNQALQATIDNLYTSNNVLERNDVIVTSNGKADYGIEGIIKDISIIADDGKAHNIPYDNNANPNDIVANKKRGLPRAYVISNGYLRLLPTPDKAYKVHVCVSTTDLVMSDDDTSRTVIKHINDSIVANDRFCNLVITKAIEILFARLQNPSGAVYAKLYDDNLRTFIEHDIKSLEANRGYNRSGGWYDLNRGLFDNDMGGSY